MHTLILGGRGQLGTDLTPLLDHDGVALDRAAVDITDPMQVDTVLRAAQPAVVVNCAAWTNVEQAEIDAQAAFDVNALGALHVARASAAIGAWLIHVSTDYVFGGGADRRLPYVESDAPAPLNVYGASKLAGEALSLAYHPRCTVVRVASLYGHAGARGKGGNFVETMLRLASSQPVVRVVADQLMSPTSTKACARFLAELVRRPVPGVIHAAGSGACSWCEFAAGIFSRWGLATRAEPIRAAEYPTKARRPANSALGSERLAAAGLAPLPPWQEQLAEYLAARPAQ